MVIFYGVPNAPATENIAKFLIANKNIINMHIYVKYERATSPKPGIKAFPALIVGKNVIYGEGNILQYFRSLVMSKPENNVELDFENILYREAVTASKNPNEKLEDNDPKNRENELQTAMRKMNENRENTQKNLVQRKIDVNDEVEFQHGNIKNYVEDEELDDWQNYVEQNR